MGNLIESLSEHVRLIGELDGVLGLTYEPAVSLLFLALAAGNKILLCGNGGSLAQASHFAAELTVRFSTDRRALAAIALNDPQALTACANDYRYDQVFARQIEALGTRGDVLVGISTSGKSANVNEAIRKARHQGMATLGLSGALGLLARPEVDIVVPSTSTARVQEAHALIIHLLCEGIEDRLPKGDDPRFKC